MQLLLARERHFTIALWMPVRQSATTPASLNGCGVPWGDASRRALNLVEDILRTYYKCTLSAITHKLNVSGHMLIWTFFLVLVCGTRAQNLSASFSFTHPERYPALIAASDNHSKILRATITSTHNQRWLHSSPISIRESLMHSYIRPWVDWYFPGTSLLQSIEILINHNHAARLSGKVCNTLLYQASWSDVVRSGISLVRPVRHFGKGNDHRDYHTTRTKLYNVAMTTTITDATSMDHHG
jgi:hypothetical protein